MKTTTEFVFFYGSKDSFSNLYKASFTVHGITFCCGEQYIMYCKAMLFKDFDTAQKILVETTPSKMKALGRKVKTFDDETWCDNREYMTYIGLLAKYQQNPDLIAELIATGNREIVEASQRDKVWGIGMSESNADIEDKYKWKGKNILGKILMRVRDHIVSEMLVEHAFNKS